MNAWLQLFRTLIPSWRFFDEIVELPILSVRYAARGSDFGPWLRRWEGGPKRRHWRNLFLNAQENHLLACQSLLNQLEVEIEAGQQASKTVSWKLIERIVLIDLPGDPQKSSRAAAHRAQFKVDFPGREPILSQPMELVLDLTP